MIWSGKREVEVRGVELGFCCPVLGWNGGRTVVEGTYHRRLRVVCAMGSVEEGEKRRKNELSRMSGNVARLMRVKKVRKAFEKLDKMMEAGMVPDVVRFNRILSMCTKVGAYKEAERMFQIMRHVSVMPNSRSYALLIKIYCRRNDQKTIQARKMQMLRDGVEPQVDVYNAILRSFLATKDRNAAKELLREMKGRDVRFNFETVEILMQLFYLCEDRDALLDLYELFRPRMKKLPAPSPRAYSLLVRGLAKCQDERSVSAVLQEMEEINLRPDSYSLCSLVTMRAMNGDEVGVDDAFSLMEQYRLYRVQTEMFNAALEGYCKGGWFEAAKRCRRRMLLQQVRGDCYTASSLVRICAFGGGSVQQVKSTFGELVASGIRPNAVMYGGLIVALCHLDDIAGAETALKRMQKDKIVPNAAAYNALLLSYTARCTSNEVRYLLRAMAGNKVRASLKANTEIMKLFCEEGSIQDAQRLLRTMRSRGIYPEREAILALCKAFDEIGDSQSANGLRQSYLE